MNGMNSEALSFCVIGAGITGLSSAYCLAKKYPGCRVTVVYENCTPDTTSNHSFGICSLRGVDEYDGPNTLRFARATARYCANLVIQSPQLASEMGVRAVVAYLTYDRKQGSPSQATFSRGPVQDTFAYFMKLGDDEVRALEMDADGLKFVFEREDIKLSDIDVYKAGTWIIDNHSYLPWLRKELELMAARGDISCVNFIQKRISDFSELLKIEDFDFVVNCSGLGSEYLVPDKNMIPIRGQYMLVKPTTETELRYGGHTFVCPKPDRIALGSVYQIGRRDTALSQRDRQDIIRRCSALKIDIKDCDVIGERVGIRPGRYGGPRVELEYRQMSFFGSSRSIPVIHNYGHGAKGILQHWGSALEVVELAEMLASKSKL